MKWFNLSPKDQRHNNWVFNKEGPPVTLRERYEFLRCRGCGKMDEDKALLSGIDEGVRMKSRSDIVQTSDDVLCFSVKAQQVYYEHRLQGLQFLKLPSDPKFCVALPVHLLPVDMERAGFEYAESRVISGVKVRGGMCDICGRPRRDAVVGPLKESYQLPDDPLIICSPSVVAENMHGKMYRLLVSETVKNMFKSAGLTGAEYTKPN